MEQRLKTIFANPRVLTELTKNTEAQTTTTQMQTIGNLSLLEAA